MVAPALSLRPARIILLSSVLSLTAWACSDSDKEKIQAKGLSAGCTLNSECSEPLVCTFARCHQECAKDRDCTRGEERCVKSTNGYVCQLPVETDCTKDRNACKGNQVCGVDGECRDACSSPTDCAPDQVCAPSGECASTDPKKDTLDASGNIVPDPFVDASGDTGGTGGTSSTGKGGATGKGGSMSSGGAPEMSGGAGGEPPVETSGGKSTTGAGGKSGGLGGAPGAGGSVVATGGAGGEGGVGPVACVPACPQGRICVDGTCAVCGGSGQACCVDGTCAASLTCNANGKCSCGAANEVCCAGDVCNSGLSCDTSGATHVCACGQLGARCCAAAVQGGDPTCLGDNLCAGAKCSCIAELEAGYYTALVRRTDGTVLRTNNSSSTAFSQVKYASGDALVATSVAAAYTIGCAVVAGGSVWCFPMNGTLTDSTFLGAGLTSADQTATPVQVVTAPGGPALTGVVQLAASSTTSSNPSFCAVTSDGAVWCWGYGYYGQLGHGDTSNANFARKVMVNATTPFSGAAEAQIGVNTTCARKTDGTAWCWGTNSYGELGVPQATKANSYYPVQITFAPGTAAQTTSKRLMTGPSYTHCTIMQDSSVECWGNNNYSQASGASSSTTVPKPVLLAQDAAGLTGIVDLTGAGPNGVCAKTADRQLLCWGNVPGLSGTKEYPATYTDNTNTAVTDIRGNLSGGYYFTYIDVNGKFTMNGSVQTQQPSCD